jgi:hypothetical protein
MATTNKTNVAGVFISVIEPNILRAEVPKDLKITLPMMKELAAHGQSVFPNQKRKILTVFDSYFVPSREASDYMVSTERMRMIEAEAFCINSSALRMMTNFYLKIKRPNIPSRAFDNEALALAWLRSL